MASWGPARRQSPPSGQGLPRSRLGPLTSGATAGVSISALSLSSAPDRATFETHDFCPDSIVPLAADPGHHMLDGVVLIITPCAAIIPSLDGE